MTPAGWYDDAYDPARWRWWDGQSWTDRYTQKPTNRQQQVSGSATLSVDPSSPHVPAEWQRSAGGTGWDLRGGEQLVAHAPDSATVGWPDWEDGQPGARWVQSRSGQKSQWVESRKGGRGTTQYQWWTGSALLETPIAPHMVKRAYVGDLLSRKVWGLLLAAWAVAALVSLGGAVVLWATAGVDESSFYGLLFAFLLWLVVNLPAGLFLALHLGSGRMLRGFAYVWLAPVVTLLLRA